MLKVIATIALALTPSLSWGHEMSPSFETEISANGKVYKDYQLKNAYSHPAVFEVEVFNKDFTPAENWKAKKTIFKMLPNSTKEIKLKFKADTNRKLIVCSTLTEIGKNNEKSFNQSRVCSRLIIITPDG